MEIFSHIIIIYLDSFYQFFKKITICKCLHFQENSGFAYFNAQNMHVTSKIVA